MNWWNRFGRSLLFAILVAAAYPIYASLGTYVLGRNLSFAAYVLTTAAVYLIGISTRPTLGLGAGLATFVCGFLVVVGGASGGQLVLVTGVLIGVFRSGLLHVGRGRDRSGFTRRFIREVVFIGGGLAMALYMARGSLHPEAFAFWGFYLTQAGFFLLGGEAARGRAEGTVSSGPDAFGHAVKRAREVLTANP
jgi:hypothetical protein